MLGQFSKPIDNDDCQPLGGVCGAANGGVYTSVPTANLCSIGSAGNITGDGPWRWVCNGLGGGAAVDCSADAAKLNTTGSMTQGRHTYTATLLLNGKVLITGGSNGSNILKSAELYDPLTGTFSATGNMTSARYFHTATRLPNGKVLISGGYNGASVMAGAELYDPDTGTFSVTGNMTSARYVHTATLLSNGKILIAGGYNNSSGISSAELYDPAGGTFSAAGSMTIGRFEHTATLLPNGKVLIAGGYKSSSSGEISTELYDPNTNTFVYAGNMTSARYFHTATLLTNGKVIIAGGHNGGSVVNKAELYDPTTNSFTATNNMTTARYEHTATLLPNGNVLLIGGYNSSGGTNSIEVYSPATNSFNTAGNMASARFLHTATLLSNGKVLIAGGSNGSSTLNSAELYEQVAATITLNISISGNGSVHATPEPDLICTSGNCTGNYPLNTSVTLTSTPATNYYFVNWTDSSGNVVSTLNPLILTNITTNTNMTANFSIAPVNGVCGSADGGIFTTTPTTNLCLSGASSTVTGSGPWYWSCLGSNGGNTADCSAISTNVNLRINFTGSGNGSVIGTTTGTPANISINTNGKVSITREATVNLQAKTAEYSLFTTWSGACSGTDDCVLNMDGDKNVTVEFTKDTAHMTWIDGTTGYFQTLQGAYNKAVTGKTIKAWGTDFSEDLTCNINKSLILKGGYDMGYATNSGKTILNGKLTIQNGSVTIDKLIIR